MSSQQNSLKRPAPSQRRLLGDARRETTAAVHIAASKRRRLAAADDDQDVEEDEENNPTDTRALDDNDVAVFADAVYEQDDVEADQIYAEVDKRMDSRRQKQREGRLEEELRKYREANPTIRQQFADLKADLGDVSADQWASIPDIGDYSVKKTKFQKFTPVPDSLLERAQQESAYVAAEPSSAGTATDLASIGAGRTSVLGQNLDRAGNDVSQQTNVDTNAYLADLAGVKISTESEIGDIKKARFLLKSVISTNPKHAPGWIAAARLEETAGKISVARTIMLEGCRKCPKDEDVWVEAARLHPPQVGRRILAQAVKSIPKSDKIWLQASVLEEDPDSKKRVLRKALEVIPRSAILWKAAVELEDASGARILLSRAVECVPSALELWLALSRLEPYEKAKDVLQRARRAIPNETSVWITGAQLEEANHGTESAEIANLVSEGVQKLSVESNTVKPEKWMEEAERADDSGYPGTVKALIRCSIGLGVSEGAREEKWSAEASKMEDKGRKEVARGIYEHMVTTFKDREDLWGAYADFERRCKDGKRLQDVLNKAVGQCPQAQVLWLMLAKELWKTKNADEGREILKRAFKVHADSEAIWLAAAKIESESGEVERARGILEKARQNAGSAKVFMKSALLERQEGDRDAERRMLEVGLERYGSAEKLWLMLGQWYEDAKEENEEDGMDVVEDTVERTRKEGGGWVRQLRSAREVYSKGVVKCAKCVHLWIRFARLEERRGGAARARAILERGREKCKGVEDMDVLWRESVYLEVRDSKRQAAMSMMARALQECKRSGRLWALSIGLENRKGQKARSADAVRECGQDGVVMLEVAKLVWRSGKVDKARAWLRRSVELDADWGDSWAILWRFEREHGDDESVRKVEQDVMRADPRHGDVWPKVSKRVGNEAMTREMLLRHVASLVSKECDVRGTVGDTRDCARSSASGNKARPYVTSE